MNPRVKTEQEQQIFFYQRIEYLIEGIKFEVKYPLVIFRMQDVLTATMVHPKNRNHFLVVGIFCFTEKMSCSDKNLSIEKLCSNLLSWVDEMNKKEVKWDEVDEIVMLGPREFFEAKSSGKDTWILLNEEQGVYYINCTPVQHTPSSSNKILPVAPIEEIRCFQQKEKKQNDLQAINGLEERFQIVSLCMNGFVEKLKNQKIKNFEEAIKKGNEFFNYFQHNFPNL